MTWFAIGARRTNGVASSGPATIGDPSSEILGGAAIASLFFVVFLGWAAVARLDAAVYAEGSIVVSGQRQSVQHVDGGVVGDLLVRDGQRVHRGQVLMRLAAADVDARERGLASQVINLLARRARLQAELLGGAIQTPVEFGALPSRDQTAAELAMRLQRNEMAARVSLAAAQKGTLRERVAQSSDERVGLRRQVSSHDEQLRLLDVQLAALMPLAERGFVSKTRIRELQRTKAALEGQRGEYLANAAQSSGVSRERRMQIVEVDQSFREHAATELREVEASLGDILPQLAAARDRLARIEIRAPVSGTLIGMSVFTPGGVIGAGQKLVDIVPDNIPLTIQARIDPTDADDLAVGQRTLVKLPALNEQNLPDLAGTLTRLSADSLSDERTGQAYFSCEIMVPTDQLRLVNGVRGVDFKLRPGTPVQVLVPLKPRTALEYALEPLFGAFWRSFHEQ